MRLEEDAAWPGKTEQLYVEFWFSLEVEQRRRFADTFDEFILAIKNAVDPMAMGSTWDSEMKRWSHTHGSLRFIYAGRRDQATGQWIATIDAFYLIDS